MDMRLEVVVVPVSDVDRAKAFYTEKAGFNVDVDRSFDDRYRVVQLTPPSSACSITLMQGMDPGMEPGSLQGLQITTVGWRRLQGSLDVVDAIDVLTRPRSPACVALLDWPATWYRGQDPGGLSA